jgi:hypothetical protein
MKINGPDQTLKKVRDMRERNIIFFKKKRAATSFRKVFGKKPLMTPSKVLFLKKRH